MSEPSARALAPGLTHATSVTVTADLTPAHLRGDPIRGLATPEAIRLAEPAATQRGAAHPAPGPGPGCRPGAPGAPAAGGRGAARGPRWRAAPASASSSTPPGACRGCR